MILKNYKNRLRLAKVAVKNKLSHFYGSLCRIVPDCDFCFRAEYKTLFFRWQDLNTNRPKCLGT